MHLPGTPLSVDEQIAELRTLGEAQVRYLLERPMSDLDPGLEVSVAREWLRQLEADRSAEMLSITKRADRRASIAITIATISAITTIALNAKSIWSLFK